MRKKLFTLMTLTLMSIGSVWADKTIFSYTLPNTTAGSVDANKWDSRTASGTIGGTCSFYYDNDKGKYATFSDVAAYYLNGAAASIKLTLAGSEKFEKGDKVTVTFSSNGGSSRSFLVRTAKGEATNQLTSAAHTNTFSDETVTLTANFNLNEIFIERNGGGMYISSVTVVRPEADTASPTIDTDLSTTPVDVDVNVGTTLSISASHVTDYQWYRNTSASTTGAEAISGATTASYSYTAPAADAETTVYFYCVVTNENATGEKTATSSFAQVNVGAIPTLSAVTNNIWSAGSVDTGDYTIATIINNLEICNGTVDGSSQTFDGISSSNRIKLNKDAEGTSKYVKFKVGGNCIITVYGMTGKSGKERELGMKIGGSDVATLKSSTYDMGKMTYTYTGSETEVILHTIDGDGTFNIYGITVSDVNIPVSAYEWATFVSDKALAFGDLTGIEAYIVTGHEGSALTKAQMEGTVPANTPLLIKGTASTTFYIPLAGGSTTDVSANKLKAGDGSVVSAESGKTKYVLGVSGGNATFLKVNATAATVPAGKAYLQFDEVISAPSLDFNSDGNESSDVVTSIDTVKTNKENSEFYNLNGQRIAQPSKGLYIVNGKKVIIK